MPDPVVPEISRSSKEAVAAARLALDALIRRHGGDYVVTAEASDEALRHLDIDEDTRAKLIAKFEARGLVGRTLDDLSLALVDRVGPPRLPRHDGATEKMPIEEQCFLSAAVGLIGGLAGVAPLAAVGIAGIIAYC